MELNINFNKNLEKTINSYQPLRDWFDINQELMAYFELTHSGCTHFENSNVNYDIKVLGRLANACLSILENSSISDEEKATLASKEIDKIYNREKDLLSDNAKEKYKINIIKKAKFDDIFVEQLNPFNANGPVYAFTNEALCQYMPNYDFCGKSVLASLGSGDFSLNALLYGASKVDSFDINLYTYFFYQLKRALIIQYNYEEFTNLVKEPSKIFERYEEYNNLLDNDSKIFFDRLLKMSNMDYNEILKKMYIDKIGEKFPWNESNTFSSYEELFLVAQYKNPYLQSQKNYEQLRNLLKNGTNENFFGINLYEYNSNEKYDIIYLSNIGDYNRNPEDFKVFLEKLKNDFLKENGIIIVVSITNTIYLDDDYAERTIMDWEPMKKFNNDNGGKAELPICNLGIQNVYTTHPYQKNQIRRH